MLDLPAEEIVRKDRLRPGKMLLVDTIKGELVDDERLKADYAGRQPYGEWLDRNLVPLSGLKVPNKKVPPTPRSSLSSCRRRSATGMRMSRRSCCRWRRTAASLPGRWAAIPRWPF